MNTVVSAVSAALLVIASLVCFVTVMRTVLPNFVLRLETSLEKGIGRGYKRFVYPTGRAVAYEPHPSVRKFVNRYLLFVNDGYKYFKCRVDKGVRSIKYVLVMMNNKDEVIDTLEVEENIGEAIDGGDVLLHPDTSYVAFSIESVNGSPIKSQSKGYYTFKRVAIYFAAVLLVSFFELLIVSSCVEKFVRLAFSFDLPIGGLAGRYFLWSILIAIISLSLLLLYFRKKGIKVVRYGKQQSNS